MEYYGKHFEKYHLNESKKIKMHSHAVKQALIVSPVLVPDHFREMLSHLILTHESFNHKKTPNSKNGAVFCLHICYTSQNWPKITV